MANSRHDGRFAVDLSAPHPARVHDYFLGGKDNFAADREFAHELLRVVPSAAEGARRGREFTLRAVHYLVAELGVRQIVDLGPGIPTAPTVHGVARAVDPRTVVAYVHDDPIVLSHSRALLSVDPDVETFGAAPTDPAAVLEHPDLDRLVDLSRPIGVLMTRMFHFLPDDREVLGIIAGFRERLAPGSVVVISVRTWSPDEVADGTRALEAMEFARPVKLRSRAQIARFFEGFRLVEPGLVALNEWRPTQVPATPTAGGALALGGVAVLEH